MNAPLVLPGVPRPDVMAPNLRTLAQDQMAVFGQVVDLAGGDAARPGCLTTDAAVTTAALQDERDRRFVAMARGIVRRPRSGEGGRTCWPLRDGTRARDPASGKPL